MFTKLEEDKFSGYRMSQKGALDKEKVRCTVYFTVRYTFGGISKGLSTSTYSYLNVDKVIEC